MMRPALLVALSLACCVLGCKPPDCSVLSDNWLMAQVGIATHQANAANCLCPQLGGPDCGPHLIDNAIEPDAGGADAGGADAGAPSTIPEACISCLRSCSGSSPTTASVSSCLRGACASACPGGS